METKEQLVEAVKKWINLDNELSNIGLFLPGVYRWSPTQKYNLMWKYPG